MIRPHEPLGLELLFAHLLLTPMASRDKRRCDTRHALATNASVGSEPGENALSIAMRVFGAVKVPGSSG